MNPFPVAPEMMQAFPIGALNLLVSVVSTIAAQHGVDSARRVCGELAANDELWVYIANHLGNPVGVASDRMLGTELGGAPANDLLRNDPDANARHTAGQAPIEGQPLAATEPPESEAAPRYLPEVSAVAITAEPEVTRVELTGSTRRRAGARKAKTSRKPKTTGREREP